MPIELPFAYQYKTAVMLVMVKTKCALQGNQMTPFQRTNIFLSLLCLC